MIPALMKQFKIFQSIRVKEAVAEENNTKFSMSMPELKEWFKLFFPGKS